MMVSSDPFALVFDALWTLTTSNPLITAVVKPGNMAKYNSENNRDPLKQKILTADLPELVITSEGSSFINMNNTSCTSMIIRRYAWLVSTGDQRITSALSEVEWGLFVGMLKWPSVLNALEFEGNRFVKRVNFVDVANGLSDAERNRGIVGWSAVWRCEVEMHFNNKFLISQLEGSSNGSS